jgi:hypothetical protein
MINDFLLPEVHDSLASAIGRTVAPAVRAPRDRRPRLNGSRRTALLMAAGVLATGAALAATAPWSPIVGNDQQGHPTTSVAPLPADELAALGVLRRPQTDPDRSPEIAAMLKVLNPNVDNGVHPDDIRLLQSQPAGFSVLVPIDRDVTNAPGYGGPPQVDNNVLCLFVASPPTSRGATDATATVYGQKCGTVADLKAGRILMGGQYGGRLTLTGLVPDGVTTIQLPLRNGTTITAPVTNNSFHINTDAPDGSYEDAPIRWLRSDAAAKTPADPTSTAVTQPASATAVDPSIKANYAAFRRAPTTADRLPSGVAARFNGDPYGSAPDLSRVAGVLAGGAEIFLVPARGWMCMVVLPGGSTGPGSTSTCGPDGAVVAQGLNVAEYCGDARTPRGVTLVGVAPDTAGKVVLEQGGADVASAAVPVNVFEVASSGGADTAVIGNVAQRVAGAPAHC